MMYEEYLTSVQLDTWNMEIGLSKKTIRFMLGIKPLLLEYLIKGNTDVLAVDKHEVSEKKEIFNDGTFIKIEL